MPATRPDPLNHDNQQRNLLKMMLMSHIYKETRPTEEKDKQEVTPEKIAKGSLTIGQNGEGRDARITTLLGTMDTLQVSCDFVGQADRQKETKMKIPKVTLSQVTEALLVTYEDNFGSIDKITGRGGIKYLFGKEHHAELLKKLGFEMTGTARKIHLTAGGLSAEKQQAADRLEDFVKTLKSIADRDRTNVVEAEQSVNQVQAEQEPASTPNNR
jgi:hypothetical protein